MTTLKTCFKCGKDKPLDEFYVHKQMADGHLGKCRECTKRDVAERYRDPLARKRITEYERKRFHFPNRKSNRMSYQRKMRKIHHDKYIARNAVGNAVRDARLTPKPCEVCGDTDAQAHHRDYDKPLEVSWLCFQHHREEHGQIVYANL